MQNEKLLMQYNFQWKIYFYFIYAKVTQCTDSNTCNYLWFSNSEEKSRNLSSSTFFIWTYFITLKHLGCAQISVQGFPPIKKNFGSGD